VLPGTGVDSAAFWKGFDAIVADLAPKNIALLAERDRLQTELDAWHKANPGPITGMKAYRAFLEKIGYLVPVPAHVKATTKNVDAELATAGRPAAGGADPERPLRAERRQRPLGQPVRRAVRHRRHPERPTALKRARATTRARRQGHRIRPPCAGPHRAAGPGSHKDATGYTVVGGKLVGHAEGARPPA
jgi:malate synthase